MSKPDHVFMPLINLPSGACVRPDLITFIARKELGKYVVFFQHTNAATEITTADLDILKGLGVVQTPEDPEKTAPQGTLAAA